MTKCPEGCTCGRHAYKGKRRSDEVRARISAAKMGHVVTPGTRKKISEAMAGRKQAPAAVAARAEALTGHGHNRSKTGRRSPTYRSWDGMKQR